MCGIRLEVWQNPHCLVCQAVFRSQPHSTSASKDEENENDVGSSSGGGKFRNLFRRGPDANGMVAEKDFCDPLSPPQQDYHICLRASVLQMRRHLQEQPVRIAIQKKSEENDDDDDDDDENNNTTPRDDSGSAYLCWNGEVYEQAGDHDNQVWQYNVSDTLLVANRLGRNSHNLIISSSRTTTTMKITPQQYVADVMSSWVNAEFAFLVLTRQGVYFGRDVWGRRSLLKWNCPQEDCESFIIASVAEHDDKKEGKVVQSETTLTTTATIPSPLEWMEIPPGQVHSILFSANCANVKHPQDPVPFSPPQTLVPPHPPEESTMAKIPPTIKGISDQLWRASLELEFHLRRAVSMRLKNDDDRHADTDGPGTTGILFSGGVDSAVLAALAADIIAASSSSNATSTTKTSSAPPRKLHLYNVSFGPDRDKSEDRRAALVSYEAIQERYAAPGRLEVVFHDNFVGWQDVCAAEPHIRTLLQPKSTVMDINIATALWFASRGVNHDDKSLSPRVLLLGMGADEQMGGYGRHRKAYQQGGWEKLRQELELDLGRLWERNLGRDDRLVLDHGKEARFPFLDAHVVQFLQGLQQSSPQLICNMDLPPGKGDKQILRLVAKRLGLDHASELVKRAIQFGSRISHLSDTKRFGSRRKAKGETTI